MSKFIHLKDHDKTLINIDQICMVMTTKEYGLHGIVINFPRIRIELFYNSELDRNSDFNRIVNGGE
jgi:hypothetical protein